ncbi:hypothetical protein U14_00032 [Candidatus Moduliflexus flocculans]|uniref:Impact N-terminal domain-containing protein n=1 Tax=Candidatus Moduliflexus flocculans TaxID=1499966 RepID=A0A0S6VP63_9BACT|nr:hypothetical protein U14_00032 [Candidatus Moduliflexus flocculans]
MPQRYPIPASTVRAETIVTRSKFIATIGAADSVDAARDFIQRIRNEMPDATHHVYAFRVGYGSSVQEGLSDDGEPAGTSGKPVMAVLRGADIGDVVLVVTRYFGGTKLGTGGLVRAYSGAAKTVIEQLPLTEKIVSVTMAIACSYANFEPLKRQLPHYEATLLEEKFAEHVMLTIRVPEDKLRDFSREIAPFRLK